MIAGEFYQSPYGLNKPECIGSDPQSLVKDFRGSPRGFALRESPNGLGAKFGGAN